MSLKFGYYIILFLLMEVLVFFFCNSLYYYISDPYFEKLWKNCLEIPLMNLYSTINSCLLKYLLHSTCKGVREILNLSLTDHFSTLRSFFFMESTDLTNQFSTELFKMVLYREFHIFMLFR